MAIRPGHRPVQVALPKVPPQAADKRRSGVALGIRQTRLSGHSGGRLLGLGPLSRHGPQKDFGRLQAPSGHKSGGSKNPP